MSQQCWMHKELRQFPRTAPSSSLCASPAATPTPASWALWPVIPGQPPMQPVLPTFADLRLPNDTGVLLLLLLSLPGSLRLWGVIQIHLHWLPILHLGDPVSHPAHS